MHVWAPARFLFDAADAYAPAAAPDGDDLSRWR
jgi:hypothetical protein